MGGKAKSSPWTFCQHSSSWLLSKKQMPGFRHNSAPSALIKASFRRLSYARCQVKGKLPCLELPKYSQALGGLPGTALQHRKRRRIALECLEKQQGLCQAKPHKACPEMEYFQKLIPNLSTYPGQGCTVNWGMLTGAFSALLRPAPLTNHSDCCQVQCTCMGNKSFTSPSFLLPKYTNASCDHNRSGAFKTAILPGEIATKKELARETRDLSHLSSRHGTKVSA